MYYLVPPPSRLAKIRFYLTTRSDTFGYNPVTISRSRFFAISERKKKIHNPTRNIEDNEARKIFIKIRCGHSWLEKKRQPGQGDYSWSGGDEASLQSGFSEAKCDLLPGRLCLHRLTTEHIRYFFGCLCN